MRKLSGLILPLVLLAISPLDAQPKAEQKSAEEVRFPLSAKAATSAKLTKEVFYVIEADAQVIVTSSPLGLVSIVQETGPIRARGVFSDGTGKVETRNFAAKQVFFIEASGVGSVEILVIPANAKTESDILRKTIQVDAGVGPRPPPKQEDPPKPSPIPVDGFRVLIVEESADRAKLPKEQAAIIFDKEIRDFLTANCAKDSDYPNGAWRIWDKDTDTAGAGKTFADAMKRPRSAMPWIIIGNHPNGGYEGPLPKSVEETMALLKKYRGK